MNWSVRLDALSVLGPQYGANVKARPPAGLGIRYVRITDIDDYGRLRQDSVAEPDEVSLDDYMLQPGDLLFARSGATVGKTYKHESADGVCAFAGYLIRFRPNPQVVLPDYLKYYFQTSEYWAWVHSKKRVAAQPNINGAEYAALQVPLRPLSEQARIVELLDDADRLRQVRRDADAKAARILSALFLKMFGDPATNSMGWPTVDFGSVVEIGTKLVDPNEPQYRELLHVGGENIERDTGRLLQPQKVADSDLRSGKFLFDEEHVLYSKIRPALNKVCIPGFPGLCSADIYPLRPRDGRVRKHYLVGLLRSSAFLNFTETVADRLRIPKINREQLSKFSFPLPPPELISLFEHRASAIASLDLSLFTQAQRLEQVWSVMLAQAVSGQLTARWREGHMTELLAEMAHQARALNFPWSPNVEALP